MSISTSNRPRISVIDRNKLFRGKLCFLLTKEAKEHYEILDEFNQLESAIAFLRHHKIDLLLLEAALLKPGKSMDQLKRCLLLNPTLKVVLLTTGDQEIAAQHIQSLDVHHTLTKTIDSDEFLDLVDKIIKNRHYPEKTSTTQTLTPREEEILTWLVKGDSNKEIARELDISESTVKVHVQNILKKFNVSSRVEAAVYAVRNELRA